MKDCRVDILSLLALPINSPLSLQNNMYSSVAIKPIILPTRTVSAQSLVALEMCGTWCNTSQLEFAAQN